MDKLFMKKALILAKKGKGFVDPNPLVGAVIVKDGRIIGQGYHQKFGEAHAEVMAINHSTESVEGASIYVTLEPCAHFGKTPPCAMYIIKNKISRVVIASIDPNPLVAGKGITMLKDAGIDVLVGCLDQENKLLNKVFFKYIQTKMPYVILKTAMTLDGKIATHMHQSKWITNEKSRKLVHQMRHELMSIMVGVNTITFDNPRLTCRLNQSKIRQPIRVVLDTNLEIPIYSDVVSTAKLYRTMLFTSNHLNLEKIKQLISFGLEIYQVTSNAADLNLKEVMHVLADQGISSVLLEGGSTLNYSMLKSGFVDEIQAFIAPKIIGGKHAITPVGGQGFDHMDDAIKLEFLSSKNIQGDILLAYRVKKEE